MKKIIITSIFIVVSIFSSAQTITNEQWTQLSGIPDPQSISTSCVDYQNNVITATSEIVAGQDANILVTKYDMNGSTIWQNTFNGNSNGKDYSTSVKTDENGNVYVIGTSFSSSTHYDYVIIKYSEAGNQEWINFFNGSGNNVDVPSALILDSLDYVYVTGFSMDSTALSDFVTIKYSSAGVQQWYVRYDYAMGHEVPAGIEYNPITNHIYVTGASASTQASINWDIVVIEYNDSGAVINTNRVVSQGNGFDKPTAICKDNAGNIYLTGAYFNQNNGSYDIKTLKLSANLNLEWVVTYDGENLEDRANSIDIDASGNVFIAGYVSTTTSGHNIIVLKYSPTGTLLWNKEFSEPGIYDDDEGNGVIVDNNGNAYLTGTYVQNGNKNFVTMKISSSGTVAWENFFNGTSSGDDAPTSICLSSDGNIIVSGFTETGNNFNNITISYNELEINPTFITDTNNSPIYYKNELLAKIEKQHLNLANVNNKKLRFAYIEDFVDQQTVSSIYNKLNLNYEEKILFVKVHPNRTSFDTLLVSRIGDTIRPPDFYRTFRIILPVNVSETAAYDSLITLYPLCEDVQLNLAYVPCSLPDDDEFINGEQAGLNATATYPNADIKMDGAWDISTGRSEISVAVFDTGINWDHEDFGDGTFSGSKIKGGYDYFNNTPITNNPNNDINGHGTACAGIIGALRNNGKGVAGIAGGDMALGTPNPGVSLYNYKMASTAGGLGFVSASSIYLGAMVDAIWNSNIDVFANSWRNPYSWGQCYNYADANLTEAVRTAFEAQRVFVCSSGNEEPQTDVYLNTNTFPASFPDSWVIKVGASDNTGERWYKSVYGSGVDVIAPGVSELYATCDYNSNNTYTFTGNGTSLASPHVSGVAALMLSSIDNQSSDIGTLTPEDVENVLQYSATDVGAVGPDIETGSGRVNAEAALKATKLPYRYRHYTYSFTANDLTLVASNQVKLLPVGYGGLAAGNYYVDVYKAAKINYHTIPGNETLLGAWERDSRSSTIGLSGSMEPKIRDASMPYYDHTQSNMEGYFYHVVATWPLGQALSYWIPFNPNANITKNFAYTLFTYDNALSIDEKKMETISISVYPNPTDQEVNITFNSKFNESIKIHIYDAVGKEVYTDTKTCVKGVNNFKIDISEYPKGIYFCKLIGSKTNCSEKFVIK